MSETWEVRLPDDVSERLEGLDGERARQIVCEAVEEALDLTESAEERRDELREKMGVDSRESEELSESNETDEMTDVEKKQAELRSKIRGGR